MKKYLVLYYSWTGNSQFLAEKIAGELGGDVKRITPHLDYLMFISLLSFFHLGIRTNISQELMKAYDEIIIVGPLWGGRLIAPLRSVLNKGVKAKKIIHFAISCSVPDDMRDHKFGYGRALKSAEKICGSYMYNTIAFPNALVKEKIIASGEEPPEKISLSEENFKGAIEERCKEFVNNILYSEVTNAQ